MKRIAGFFRSILPADLTQLVFILGVVCLFIAPHLWWWPRETITTPLKRLVDPRELLQQAGGRWRLSLSFALYPVIFASIAGYFVCFRPGSRPVRRILWTVYLPALVGLGLFCGLFLYLVLRPSSVLETVSITAHIGRAQSMLCKLGIGLNFVLIGLILIGLFTLRLAFGIASLPLALPDSSICSSDDPVPWRRVQMLMWILVALAGPLLMVAGLVNAGIAYVLVELMSFHWFIQLLKIVRLDRALGYLADMGVLIHAPLLGLSVWILGKDGWWALRRSLRLPFPESFVLALAFPVGISAVVSFGQYLVDRFHWVAYQIGKLAPPQIASYFGFPSAALLWQLFLALWEEIVFRGLLQPRLIRRYGLLRGIFLVGIVFAAFHFFYDFSSELTYGDVLLTLSRRLYVGLALSFVLGWLTLRTRSVLPAAVAHGVYNVLVESPLGPQFMGKGPLIVLLWGALAYVLFRYWPVQGEDEPGAGSTVANPEPAV